MLVKIRQMFWTKYYRRKLHAGRALLVKGRITISGEGKIKLGENVVVEKDTYFHVGKNATITIGNNVFLNRSGIASERSISI